jgi:type VI protein secretion system component VasF
MPTIASAFRMFRERRLARTLTRHRSDDRRGDPVPIWPLVLIIVLVVLALGGGYSYRR